VTLLHLAGMVLILMTAGLGLVSLAAVITALARRRPRHALLIAGGYALWLALHLGFVAAVSLGTPLRVLAPGGVKRFCGFYLDCHLGAAVVGRQRLAALDRLQPRGVFEVVAVEISSTARAARLRPYGLRAALVDRAGRRYEIDAVAEQRWEATHVEQPFEQTLDPGGAYRKDLVFDVPAEARGLALDIRERGLPDDVLEWLLPGDDDSFMHPPDLLALPPTS